MTGGIGSFINNVNKRSDSKIDPRRHERRESDGLSTYRLSSDFTYNGVDVNKRFSDIEIFPVN